MAPRLLLDTHIVLRCFIEPRRLSRNQLRVLNVAAGRNEPFGVCAITLLELATLLGKGSRRMETNIADVQLLPFNFEIAAEVTALGGVLRDPNNRALVSTARVHDRKLVTSDQRSSNRNSSRSSSKLPRC